MGIPARNTGRTAFICAMAAVIFLATGFASGEMTVSVTIAGPIDEILPLLQHLRNLGVGMGSSSGQSPALKVEMSSETAAAPGGAPAPAPAEPAPPPPPPPPPKPPLALLNPVVDPPAAGPRGPFTVSVNVSDPDHVVDTVACSIAGIEGASDLYDNGTHGDKTANDGVWSCQIVPLAPLGKGDHAVVLKAFNTNGAPVTAPGPDGTPQPLTAQANVTIKE
jgi:hypothetical protein